MTRKELVTKLAREIRIGARVIEIKQAALAAAAARELRRIVRRSTVRLVADKKVAEPRVAVLVRRLAVALAKYQQRAPEQRDYNLAVKLLTRRDGPLSEKQAEEPDIDVGSLIA